MSLLMDALKRAEEAKRQQQGVPAADPQEVHQGTTEPELSLEPVGAGQLSGLPDLDSHAESVDADLKATAAENGAMNTPRPARHGAPAAALAAQRSTAQNVFAAKEETSAPASPAKRILAIGGVGLLAAAGVAGYFYWQLQAISGAGNRLLARPGAQTPLRPVAPPTNLPQIPAAAPETVAAAPDKTGAETASPAAKATPPRKTAAKPTERAERPMQVTSVDAPTRARKAAAPAGAAPGEADPGVRVSAQSQESPTQRAYDELQAGRLDAARKGYEQALRADRRNADALVGLATIAQREGQTEAAERYYLQAIEADPRSAAAHAGLISLRGDADAMSAESRLKNLIAQNGTDAAATGALHFALGNLYAGQRRWSEAQPAYFKAHTTDAEQPDYLYNLAVSLDHLGQSALARQFYERALKAARNRPAAFDKSLGERRLAELQR
jgi:Tfp pilus assembly protein PilF